MKEEKYFYDIKELKFRNENSIFSQDKILMIFFILIEGVFHFKVCKLKRKSLTELNSVIKKIYMTLPNLGCKILCQVFLRYIIYDWNLK